MQPDPLLPAASLLLAQALGPFTREMNDINWMEFQERVPSKIHFNAVVDKMTGLVRETIAKWDQAGLYSQ